MKTPPSLRLVGHSVATLALAAALAISGISPAHANDEPATEITSPNAPVSQVELPAETDALTAQPEDVPADLQATDDAAPAAEPSADKPAPAPTVAPQQAPAAPTPLSGLMPGPAPLLSDAPVAAAAATVTGGTKRFGDVPKGHKFYKPITWMYAAGLTTGIKSGSGVIYKPKSTLSREAMAAFLYRQAGSPAFTMPKKGFLDVPRGHKFYKPIMWMKATSLTTGVTTPRGKAFKPQSALSREAMAAFLYRAEGSPKVSGVVFPDVPKKHKFYRAITWMKQTGLTTGVKQSNGTMRYMPLNRVTREAMAAFLHRQEGSPAFVDSGSLTLTGNSTVGGNVTVKARGWQPSTLTYSYQWRANGKSIAGATSSSYVPVAADQGKDLSVRVTGALPGQNAVSMSIGSMAVMQKGVTNADAVKIIRQTVFDQVNTIRKKNGLNTLDWAPQYAGGTDTDAKRQLVSYLTNGVGAGHVPRITYWQGYGINVPSEAPYDIIAAASSDSPQQLGKNLVASWMSSPSHCWWILRESTTAMYPGISLMDESSFGPNGDGGFAASMLAFRHDIAWDAKPGYDSMDPSWPANKVCQ